MAVGSILPMRRYKKLSAELAAAALIFVASGGCAQMTTLPNFDATQDADVASSAPQTASTAVSAQPLDPIDAPAPANTDPMLAVPPPANSSGGGGDSQRVPLGSFASGAGTPMPITQPRTQTQARQSNTSPQPIVTPVQAAPVSQSVAQPTSVPVTAPPTAPAAQQVAAAPQSAPAAVSAPAQSTPTATPAEVPAVPSAAQTQANEKYEGLLAEFLKRDRPAQETPEPDTVVISSSTSTPVVEAREFIPAGVHGASVTAAPEPVIALSAAQRNVLQRFETLKRLMDESLITTEEYAKRRQVNIGGLLPYTREAAPVGLERPVPTADAIVARLAALRRAFEMRAISPRQHALERTMILNALLPETPSERSLPKPPPADVLEGATMVGQLEILRDKDMISDDEFEAERDAIDQMLKTGRPPEQRSAASARSATSKAAAPSTAKPAAATSEGSATVAETEVTGPVLHLASFRSLDAAKKGWDEAMARNSEVLKSLRPVIRRVDLGEERGVFYRLMTGPFSSLAEAEATCIKLKQNNQFCRASADGA